MARRKKIAKKAKPNNEESPEDTTLEIEETSAQSKLRIHKAMEKQKKELRYLPLKKYYYVRQYLRHNGLQDGKIILVRYKNNGCKYSSYVGRESKHKDFLAGIMKKGLLKNQKGTEVISE